MAADVFEFLIDILKINQNLVNEYATQGPLYQLFYLLFFPTLFIIIFIWILSNRFMGQHKGLRILLAVAVYAFIILQGYYSWFVTLSKYWLFATILLGFIYFISYRGGGGAKGKVIEGGTEGGKGLFGGIITQVNPLGQYRHEVDLLRITITSIYELKRDGLGDSREVQNLINSATHDLGILAQRVHLGRKNPEIKQLEEDLRKAIRGHPPSFYMKKK